MIDEIKYVTKDRVVVDTAIRIEAEVYELCRKSATELWGVLRNKSLVSPITSPAECPEALIAAMHSNIMWNVPSGWNLYEKPKLTFWQKVKDLWT